MLDLTPKFLTITAEEEIVIPPLFNDTPSQNVGGFKADAQQLTQGKITIQGIAERILIGAATAPLTGVGIFMGADGAATTGYDFRAGDPSGNYIHWDASASTLTVVGTISVTAGGTVGGFDVGADYIRDVANSFGLASTVTGGDDVRFWAGATFANRATAPVSITEAGVLTVSSITVTGGTGVLNFSDAGTLSIKAGASDTLKLSSDSVQDENGATYVLHKEIIVYLAGTIRVKFDLRHEQATSTARGKIYINGVAAGTERTNATSTYTTSAAEDFNIGNGDRIQLYSLTDGAIGTAQVRNFRIYFDTSLDSTYGYVTI